MEKLLPARRALAAAILTIVVSCGGNDLIEPDPFAPFIVFASDRTNPTRLFRMNLDGSNVLTLTTEEAFFGSTDNSGNILVYSDGDNQLKLKHLLSGHVIDLAPNAAASFRPVVDKSGTRAVFVSERDGGDREIWVVNTDGTGLARVTNRVGEDTQPALSPDGQRIVFAARNGATSQIFVVNINGTGLTNVSNNAFDDLQPSFSLDGTKIIFSSNRNGDYDLHTMNSDGTGAALLFHRDGREFNGSFTPDGNRVVFWGTPVVPTGGQIFIADMNGSNLQNLSNNSVTETRISGVIPGR